MDIASCNPLDFADLLSKITPFSCDSRKSMEQTKVGEKRRRSEDVNDCEDERKKIDQSKQHPDVPRVDWTATSPQDFFDQFVGRRRPCVIVGYPVPNADTVLQNLQEMKDCFVQLEKREGCRDRFGHERSVARQVVRRIDTFVQDCLGEADSAKLLYLSTQENPHPGSDRQPNTQPFIGSPLDRLTSIPRNVTLAGNLHLESCHMWMGIASDTHSGLHHDFHDNFYELLAGSKVFHLFPPNDAPHLAVGGDIDRIHPNGLISYNDNPTEADGRPKVFDESQSDDVEIVTIGKGFNYCSDEDEEFDGAEETSEYSDVPSSETVVDSEIVHSEDSSEQGTGNNFCWIDPTAPKESTIDTFPSYVEASETIFTLKAGEVLYLPASWFHCVVSRGSSSDSPIHLAINHWYVPPDDLSNFNRPYKNESYWKGGDIPP